ncbi:TonB-dependent receptor [Methylophilus sp. OH31]|uniref:TonB-dependent receptor family protein n=1 Tax=Methylophilus sp. OH31 TaxID=1387312 RepID=UPI000463E557|nr:TonB-dependent receptor [Methylophilus sp. OH31]
MSHNIIKKPAIKKLTLAVYGAMFLSGAGVALAEDAQGNSEGSADLGAVVVQGKTQPLVGDTPKETIAESRATLSKSQLEKFVGLDSAVTGALKYLPGIHFSGGDTSGISEGNLSIRGFSQDQIGVTRNGIPLNDPLYLTPHSDFFGDPENYESISVIYGGQSINAPTLTASGGSIEIQTVKPTKDAGLLVKQGFGSNNTRRSFVRANLGEKNGFSAWVSASRTTADLWTSGTGAVESNRFEGNLQYEWGNNNSINAIFSIFSMRSNSYSHPTLAQYKSQPYDANYSSAINSTYGGTNGVADISAATSNSAKLQRADFKIQTYGLNGLFNLTDNAHLHVDPYFVRVTDGTATVFASAIPESVLNADVNGDGDLLDIRPFAGGVFPTQYRVGSSQKIDFDLTDTNVLQVGAWFDYTHATNQMAAIPLRSDGKPVAIDGSKIIRDVNGKEIFFTDQRSRMTTQKLWVQDSWNFASQWNAKGALAWQHTEYEGENIAGVLSGSAFKRSADYYKLLPSFSLDYQYDQNNQIYYNATTNIRVPAVASIYGNNTGGDQKAETTFNQEIGWRYSTPDVLVSAALFYDQFKNRQVSYTSLGTTSYINAGAVTTKGLELALSGKLPHNFNYRGSWTYVKAEQEDNYAAGGLEENTKGNQLFNTPKNLLSLGVGYDDGRLYSNLLARYTGSFYGDLANTEKLSGYTVVDLNLGYKFDLGSKIVKKSTISLNVNNLFDKEALSGLYAGTVSANTSSAFFAAPTYNRLQPRSVFANLTLEF